MAIPIAVSSGLIDAIKSESTNELKMESEFEPAKAVGTFSVDGSKPIYLNTKTGKLTNEPGENCVSLNDVRETAALFGSDEEPLTQSGTVIVNPQDYCVGMVALPSQGWGTHTYTYTLNMLEPIKSTDGTPIEGLYKDVLTGLFAIDEAHEDTVPRDLKLIGRADPLMCMDVIPYGQLDDMREIPFDELEYLVERVRPAYDKAREAKNQKVHQL